MNICNSITDLPSAIKMGRTFNVFYSIEFEGYTKSTCSEVKYFYTDLFIQVVVLHRIQYVFYTGTLPSEPMYLGEGTPSFREEQQFLDEVMHNLKTRQKVDWVTVTPASTIFAAYPTDSERIKFGNYVLNIAGTEEEIFGRITSKHRNMIRRGEKSEIECKIGGIELLEDYLAVDNQTWARSGETVNHRQFYNDYIKGFGDRSLIAVAYKDGIPQCGILGIYNEAMFYYMFGASADHPEPGATHYLQWKVMCYLNTKNVQKYSFVGCRINVEPGSKLENIQRFKKGFGGELMECYLFRVNINQFKKSVFQVLMKWRTGRIQTDVIDQEIRKWQDINHGL